MQPASLALPDCFQKWTRIIWVRFFEELGEEGGKQTSRSKSGLELLKFAFDLKHVPGDKADRAPHTLNVSQMN